MIECYFKDCPKHCIHFCPDEGPFCNEDECTAGKDDLVVYHKKRIEDLAKWEVKYEPNN